MMEDALTRQPNPAEFSFERSEIFQNGKDGLSIKFRKQPTVADPHFPGPGPIVAQATCSYEDAWYLMTKLSESLGVVFSKKAI